MVKRETEHLPRSWPKFNLPPYRLTASEGFATCSALQQSKETLVCLRSLLG
jgi:hypothetical protein